AKVTSTIKERFSNDEPQTDKSPAVQIVRLHGLVRRDSVIGAILWVSHLEITAKNRETGEIFRARTNEIGFYHMTVTPGIYLFSLGEAKTELLRVSDDFDEMNKDFFI